MSPLRRLIWTDPAALHRGLFPPPSNSMLFEMKTSASDSQRPHSASPPVLPARPVTVMTPGRRGTPTPGGAPTTTGRPTPREPRRGRVQATPGGQRPRLTLRPTRAQVRSSVLQPDSRLPEPPLTVHLHRLSGD